MRCDHQNKTRTVQPEVSQSKTFEKLWHNKTVCNHNANKLGANQTVKQGLDVSPM